MYIFCVLEAYDTSR